MFLRLRLQNAVIQHFSNFPVIVLLGARQVGKTTLAHQIQLDLGDKWKGQKKIEFYDLERPSHKQALLLAGEQLLSETHGLIILDEAQRMPQLFEVLRPLADSQNRLCNFLLLGSASPELIKGVSESLAGRVTFVTIPGFSLDEVGQEKLRLLWLKGGYPKAFLSQTEEDSEEWHRSFLKTIFEQDIPELGYKIPSAALSRFWNMVAHYHGQIWNASDLARSMDVTPSTVQKYRDLLSGIFFLRILPAWFENLGKRQVKSPKVYIRDSGMLHHILGVFSFKDLAMNPKYGASWEGFALEQMLGEFGEHEAYFWSTNRGAELDLMLVRRGKRYGFEFKCSESPASTKSMHIAYNDLKLEHIWLIYPGDLTYAINEYITAISLSEVLKIQLK